METTSFSFEVAFLGSGKITREWVRGFLRIGVPPAKIAVVKSRTTSSSKKIEDLGVVLSDDYMLLKKAKMNYLTVTPQGTGTVLAGLKRVTISGGYNSRIISLISGLPAEVIARELSLPRTQILTVTSNTNVSCGRGVVRFSAVNQEQLAFASNLFRNFGTYAVEKESNLIKAVVTAGSFNAVDCQYLKFGYLPRKDTTSISGWLKTVAHFLENDTPDLEHRLTECSLGIAKYLQLKTKVYVGVLGYEEKCARCVAFETFKSTLDTLIDTLITTEQNGEVLFEKHTERVATEGGCTRKGLDSIESIDCFYDERKLRHITHKMYAAALTFKNTALASISSSSVEA